MTNFHDNKDWNPKNWNLSNPRTLALWPTSMTTRIETNTWVSIESPSLPLYDQLPWQQGLKQNSPGTGIVLRRLYDQLPWQQGLKHSIQTVPLIRRGLYDQLPWQQGLKLVRQQPHSLAFAALWPTSMTTRIETQSLSQTHLQWQSLYDQLPWQQGLKPLYERGINPKRDTLWPTSMTTRIETSAATTSFSGFCSFMTNFHDNKDWNLVDWLTKCQYEVLSRFMTNFHDNKDWNYPKINAHRRIWSLYDQFPWQQGLKRMALCGTIGGLNSFMTNFHDNKDWNELIAEGIQIKSILYDQLPWQQGLKQHELLTYWGGKGTSMILCFSPIHTLKFSCKK